MEEKGGKGGLGREKSLGHRETNRKKVTARKKEKGEKRSTSILCLAKILKKMIKMSSMPLNKPV
jgi:hypothetical protein